ncbi:class F sortase [Streptomyces fuscigenes]|uniref:class F sortase n=1 Tax=Streptomyces fuscigenes TaxID=1528880 RepID=UPI001F3BBE19|nr:class F sortase [Streptomyces fuscigenes]MCF3962401.1 class F sortase [Streptomyces fuscigenes]
MAAPSDTPPAPPAVPPRSSVRALVWPAAAVLLGALLVHNAVDGTPSGAPGPKPAAVASSAPVPSVSPTTDLALPRSAPTRLQIPSIAVDAPFTTLNLDATGKLNPPPANDKNLVGWYEGGVTPGENGTSIVAGHVDTKTGPAVFLLLDDLRAGSTVDITRQDGIVATFTVDSVETFSKADFPDERVYGKSTTPQLRLITCGGSYNRQVKDYTDNVVVFAHLATAREN